MRMKIAMLAAGAAVVLAGLQAEAAPSPRMAAKQKALAEARPVGKPVDCVQLNDIRETRVRSDQVIDFYLRNGRIYRNTLAGSCPNLGFEERFTYRTSLSRLCSVDIITVLEGPDVRRGASCGLGKFQPIELPRR